jgi:YbbR domain-containing protein
MIKIPRGVTVVAIEPSRLTVMIDRRAQKNVPVVPNLNEDPAQSYVIARVETSPSTVELAGPATILEEISAVRTTPIDVAGLTETTKKSVALDLNHQPHIRAMGDGLVEVEIVVEPKMDEKWMNLAVKATGGDKASIISPDRIEILLRGPVNDLRDLTEKNGVEAYVDLTDLKPGTYVRPVVIKPPLNITLVEAKPEVFTVKVLKGKP